MTQTDGIWKDIVAAERPTLIDLFKAEPDRLSNFVFEEAGLRFDFAKTHLTKPLIAKFAEILKAGGFDAARDALFSGAVVNPTEGRAAEHTAERGQGAPESVDRAKAYHARMRALIDAIEADAMGPIRHVLHIGIGGSALGPKLLVDALGRESDRYDVEIVSNVDGAALEQALKRFDPAATLIAIASKTFTTSETMLNARSALAWMAEGGVEDPYGQVIALTAAPEKAIEFGVDETRILPFAESVGGRYSLWSSIGFPAAIALGWDAFEELLEGAGAMDRHFRYAAPEENIPVLAAFIDYYYAIVRGAQTRAIFAYDERLALLPFYLQQLEMESNGKRVTVEGDPVPISAPITWGGVGTDAQHAVFQLLHQGTHLVPVEFIAAIEPGHVLDEGHHKALLTNCFAQGAALMAGKASDDPARSYPGDRPSSTILMDELTPARLGALIAFYEHRVFAGAKLIGINPFDQFGVELGKEIAKSIESGGATEFDPSTKALIERAFG
ncbi:glucose-6-phosphate isomerase [Sphingomonas sp. ID0503]|uniref:glucose-6-phosphate isomerase n=1 Tax=Sphingomonas sp. ID0503 TaxID=3399691 RepID=UPI003AFAEBA2